jgi:TOMM system kinase/cyclase fusion protein
VSSSRELAMGAVLQGRYQVVAPLGAGGFGTVYKATQLATKQSVAVKVMHPIADEPEARRDNRTARFRREMDLCARLQHPNIVGLIDSGETDDGRLFAVFQLAAGKSLDQLLIDEGPLRAREAHYLMLQVLDALSCAHNLGVVHRDLKPANIMVVSTGSRRNALILDFGIGTIVNELNDPSYAKLTGHQEWVGTPHYIAPEQIRGNPPTARSDLYSWGLVYLECLSGHPVVSGGAGVALMFHLAADAIPIPALLRRHPLGKLIERATIKDVADRTSTAASLLSELDRCDVTELDRMAGYHAGATLDAHGVTFDGAPPGTAATVAPATVASRPIATQDRLVDGERRQITAVCCSLAPAAGLELDDLDALLAAQHARCAEVAQRFRGQLVGGLGHQVVIQFGYPTASEDDAARAARAAIAIRNAAARDRPLRGNRWLELRIGIHTGMIAYSADDSDRRSTGQIFGMIPMIASQLGARADDGAIVASHATAQALRARVAMTSLGSHAIDGLGRAVELFRIDAARAGALTLDTGGGAHSPLIGRERELAFLLERWRNVVDGTGENVVIAGEAGIGKSRLVAELGRRLAGPPAQALVWLEAHCTMETCNRVLHPIFEVIERALGLGDAAPDARLARLEAALVGLGFRPGETVPLFAALLAIPLGDRYPASELSASRRRELTLAAVVSLLLELSERAPVVLVVEDLHWADPTTLDLLGALLAATPASRILTVLCTRPELTLPWPTAATHQLQLSRLARPQVEQLVGQLAGGKALPAGVLDQIAARTDGVPLFVEELTRMVLESGALTARGERYELTGALSDVAIPTTLRALLMSRLDGLGRAKKTAQLAAALGREFDLVLLTAVGALNAEAVEQDLAALVEADLLHHKRRLRDSKWLFRQALIRDVAYESMPRRVQHKVHARIAEVIEQQFPELAAARPDLLAMHWAAADHKAQAIHYAQRAASAALMGSAFAHAIRHAREAIAWLAAAPELDPIEAELDLRVTLGVPLMMTQGFASPEVEANYLRVLELCERAGAGAVAREFAALCGLWTFRTVGGDHPGAQEAATRLTALGARTGDTSIQLAALTAHGTAVMMRGQLAEARRAFEAGLALYDPAVHQAIALVLGQDAGGMCASFLTWVHGHDGDHAAAEACAARALAICDAGAQPSTRAFVETVLGTWRCLRGDFAQAERHGALVEQLASEQGMPHWTAQARCIRGWASAGLGRAAEGAVLARAGIDALIGIGSHAAMTFYFRGHAEAALITGQLEVAAAVLDEAQRYIERSDERIHEAGLALVRARVALAADRRDAAVAAAAHAVAVAERQGAGELVRLARELHAQLATA